MPGIKCQTSVYLALIKVKEPSQSYREFNKRSNKDQVLMTSCGLAAHSHLITLKVRHYVAFISDLNARIEAEVLMRITRIHVRGGDTGVLAKPQFLFCLPSGMTY